MFWSFDHCDRWRWCRCGWIGRVGWVVKVLRLVRVQWKPPPPPGKVFWTSMWVDHGACRRRVVLPPVGPPTWLARSLRRRRRSSRRRRTKISWRLHRPARVFVRDERAGTRDERDVMPFSRDVNCCKQTRGPAAAKRNRVLELHARIDFNQ